ncbi:MAG: hypothetical protein HQ592_05050 [Planctomycetes bacterium]|nr:hypothetical protein [Planctomycetota bacterium]
MQKRKTYIILAISVVLVFVLCLLLLPNSGERTASSEKATTPQGGSPAGAAAGHAQDRDDGPAPDVSNDVGPGPKDDAVEYRLSLERGPYVRGQAIPCRVLIKNPTDALQMISRPLAPTQA